jgi:hypothetical protein
MVDGVHLHCLLETDHEFSGGHACLKPVKPALQFVQAFPNHSRLRHWLEASVLERLWQVIFIYYFADLAVLDGEGEDCNDC